MQQRPGRIKRLHRSVAIRIAERIDHFVVIAQASRAPLSRDDIVIDDVEDIPLLRIEGAVVVGAGHRTQRRSHCAEEDVAIDPVFIQRDGFRFAGLRVDDRDDD